MISIEQGSASDWTGNPAGLPACPNAPPLSSSQSPLSSVSLAVTSSASLVPAMLARTHSLRCSGSPHRAGRGGGPFWSCQKRNGPYPQGVCRIRKRQSRQRLRNCTVQREKTLRRVGLRLRRPPAVGGGWLAVPRGSQRRKRAALGETFGPGRSGIHSAPIFAAAGRWSMKASTTGR